MFARLTQRVASLSLAGLLSVAALTGCGSSSSSSTSSTGSGSPQGFPSGRPGAAFSQDPALLKKIQKCLKAAGISSSFPQGGPSGFPSGSPSGSPPTGFPSGAPSGGGPSGPGGPGGGFSDPQVQSALKACGITLKRPSGAPSGAPSS